MAVPRQLTQIAFAAPLDESTEDEILDPTVGFPVLENVRQDRRGGLSKRLGYVANTNARIDGTNRSSGRRMFAHKGAPCVISDDGLDIYSTALSKDVATGGSVSKCSVEVIPLSASAVVEAGARYDAVVCNGFLVLAIAGWSFGFDVNNGPVVSVQPASSPAVVLHQQTLVSGVTDSLFHLVSVGSTAYIAIANSSNGTIDLHYLDCTSTTTIAAGWSYAGSLASDREPSSLAFSMCALTDRVAVVYANDGLGGSRLTIATANTSGALASTAIVTSATTPDQIGADASQGTTLWVCWNENLGVRLRAFDGTTGAALGAVATIGASSGLMTTRPPVVLSTSATACIVYACPAPVGRMTRIEAHHTAGVITEDSSTDTLGCSIASQPFLREGVPYALVTASDSDQANSYSIALADVTVTTSDRYYVTPHAALEPNLMAASMSARPFTLTDGRTAYVVARLSAATVLSYEVVAFDFIDRFIWRSSTHNGVTFLSGGLLSYLSTDRVQEASFLQTPQALEASNTGSGTGPDAGDVSYVAVFKSVDGAGNLTISGVSDPITHTANGTEVLIECQPLMITSRDYRGLTTEYYRTTVGPGKVYYRVDVGSAQVSSSSGLSIVDTLTDSSLTSRPLLYGTGLLPGTGGAPLQREAPPYCADVVSFAGMLVVASGSDLWWSGQTIGGEGTWFSAEQFFITVDGDGDIIALAVQDGTLFVFKERAIWTVAGEAPADNGSAGGLGTPRRLAGDVGCIEPSSIVVTSLGVFFRSHRGLELLGRGGDPVWVGEKVQTTLAAYPYVTSAALDMHNNLIRFSLASGITDGVVSGEGRDIIFDPAINDWQSVDIKNGSGPGQSSQDACTVTVAGKQRYAWLGADGTVYVESDAYSDNGSWIAMAAETGWFKISGIQGKQQLNRLQLLARKRSDANLAISIGYNYSTTYATAASWTASQISALLSSGWPITQLRHDPNDDSEGQSIRIRIEDSATDEGLNRGLTWLALTLDITPQEGAFEVPEGAT